MLKKIARQYIRENQSFCYATQLAGRSLPEDKEQRETAKVKEKLLLKCWLYKEGRWWRSPTTLSTSPQK